MEEYNDVSFVLEYDSSKPANNTLKRIVKREFLEINENKNVERTRGRPGEDSFFGCKTKADIEAQTEVVVLEEPETLGDTETEQIEADTKTDIVNYHHEEQITSNFIVVIFDIRDREGYKKPPILDEYYPKDDNGRFFESTRSVEAYTLLRNLFDNGFFIHKNNKLDLNELLICCFTNGQPFKGLKRDDLRAINRNLNISENCGRTMKKTDDFLFICHNGEKRVVLVDPRKTKAAHLGFSTDPLTDFSYLQQAKSFNKNFRTFRSDFSLWKNILKFVILVLVLVVLFLFVGTYLTVKKFNNLDRSGHDHFYVTQKLAEPVFQIKYIVKTGYTYQGVQAGYPRFHVKVDCVGGEGHCPNYRFYFLGKAKSTVIENETTGKVLKVFGLCHPRWDNGYTYIFATRTVEEYEERRSEFESFFHVEDKITIKEYHYDRENEQIRRILRLDE